MDELCSSMPTPEVSPGSSNDIRCMPTATTRKRLTTQRRKIPKITMEDFERSDPDFVLSEKYSHCLMLEELEMADRISELSCTRATEFVEEQLRYVSELRSKRQAVETSRKPPPSYRSSEIWLRRAMRNRAGGILNHTSDDEDSPDRAPTYNARVEEALRASVMKAALHYTKEEIGEQFNRHIRKRGLDDKEIKILEDILGGPGAKDLYSHMAKKKMFKPEDSLKKLHRSGQTVHYYQLLTVLENNEDLPLLNILEWKQTTIEKLMKEGINPKEVDPCKVDWELVAERMEQFGYKFSPEQWYSVWSFHIDESIPHSEYVKKRIPELVRAIGRDWEKISKVVGPEYSAEECRTIYYESLCDMGTFNTGTPPWRELRKTFCRLGAPAEKIFKQLGRSFPRMTELLNYFHPNINITCSQLKQQILAEEHTMRVKKLKHTDAEDALLLVTVTQLKPLIQTSGFSCIKRYLPWRPTSEWRQRLRALARQWFNARLTMHEDMKLLYLANLLPSRWVEISNYFDGYDRKFCRGHYVCLQKHLSRGETLLDYHARNGSKRVSVSFPRMKRIVRFLFAFITKDCRGYLKQNKEKRTRNCQAVKPKPLKEFKGFKNDGLPSSDELRSLLYSIGTEWIIQTCKELVGTIQTIATTSRPPPELAVKSRRKKLQRTQPIRGIATKPRSPLVEYDLDSDEFDDITISQVKANFNSSSECSSSTTSRVSQDSSQRYSFGWTSKSVLPESPKSTGSTMAVAETPLPSRKRDLKRIQGGQGEGVSTSSSKPPKPKKPAGRRSGRLRKLRREVALARWRKSKAKTDEPTE